MSRLTASGSSRLARPGLRPPSSGLVHPTTQQGSRTSSSLSNNAPRVTSSPKESIDSGSVTPTASFDLGDLVVAGGTKQGKVAFVGATQFARGLWVGVVLETAEGKNDGCVNGVAYFNCRPNHGLFSKPEKLVLLKKASAQPKPAATKPLPPPATDLRVGDRVLVDGVKSGIIEFMGPTQFAKGPWIGVCLDNAEGKNDGSVNGVQYFQCPPVHGVFTRAAKVTLLPEQPLPVGRPQLPPLSMPSGPQPMPEDLKAIASQLHPGDRVLVNGSKEGTLRFVGPTHFAKGIWVGVELDIAQGKNDGAVSGKRYFQCEPFFGLFAPLTKVEKIADADIPSPAIKRGSRRLSGSSVSSMSSLSSMGKLKNMQHPMVDNGGPVRIASSPTNPLASMSSTDNLSHILFEKDHHIATLQSSLDQSDQEKMKLSEQVTDYKRQVDDLNFRLEELSVISGDQLEKVAMKDDGELDELKKDLLAEQDKCAALDSELSSVKENLHILNSRAGSSEENNQNIIQLDQKVQELESKNKTLTDELNKSREKLKSAEFDYRSTESAASNLSTDLETTKQQLQEALEVCSQQESLLEDKLNELEKCDVQSRNLQKEIDRMVSERQQLVSIQEQVSLERDQALKQCESLMSQSQNVSNEQTQLSKQRSDLLMERDQARAELRENTVYLEQVANERDEVQRRLNELLQSQEEVQGKTHEFSLQLDTTQSELKTAEMEIDKLKREIAMFKEEQEREKTISEQKIELAKAASSQLQERLNRAVEERDTALSQTQTLSDKLTKARGQMEEMNNDAIRAHNQIQTLEEQLDDVTRSHDKLAQENQMESGMVQQQFDEVQEMLELKERELQEAKEKIISLEEELVIYQSSSAGLQDDQRIAELEEEKLLLEEQLADKIQQLSSQQQQPNYSSSDNSAVIQKDQEISFLKSVITDQQTKIETLEALNGLGDHATTVGYLDSSEDDILGGGNQLPPPRVFCDICDEFDQHDTAECPLQSQVLEDSSVNTHHHSHRAHQRPYCGNCEVFGHWSDECEFEETY